MVLDAEPPPPLSQNRSVLDTVYIADTRAKITNPDLLEKFDAAIRGLENVATRCPTTPAKTRGNLGAFFQKHSTSLRMALNQAGIPVESTNTNVEGARTIADKITSMYERMGGYDRKQHTRE